MATQTFNDLFLHINSTNYTSYEWSAGRKSARFSNGVQLHVFKGEGYVWHMYALYRGVWRLIWSYEGLSNSDVSITCTSKKFLFIAISEGSKIYVDKKSYQDVIDIHVAGTYVDNGNTRTKTANLVSLDNALSNCRYNSIETNQTGTELWLAYQSMTSAYPNSWNIKAQRAIIAIDGTLTWDTTPYQITTENSSASFGGMTPSIAIMENSYPAITYQLVKASEVVIWCTRWNGTTFLGNSRQIYNSSGVSTINGQIINVPSFVNGLTNGRLWSAFSSKVGSTSNYNIYVSYSDDLGDTWVTATKLTTTNSASDYQNMNPSITANANNKISILWSCRDASSPTYYYIKKVENTGGIWGSVTNAVAPITNIHVWNVATIYDPTMKYTDPVFQYSRNLSGVYLKGVWETPTITTVAGSFGTKTDKNLVSYTPTMTVGSIGKITEYLNGIEIKSTINPITGVQIDSALTDEQWDALRFKKGHEYFIEADDYMYWYTFNKDLSADADDTTSTLALRDMRLNYDDHKVKLATKIRSKGHTANDTDIWDTLIGKAGQLGYYGAYRSASGTGHIANASSSGSTVTITVTGLAFTPQKIMIRTEHDNGMVFNVRGLVRYGFDEIYGTPTTTESFTDRNYSYTTFSTVTITSDKLGFSLTVTFQADGSSVIADSFDYKWVAFAQ